MKKDPRFQGEIGHKLAEALLLRFLVPARPEPDLGIDSIAQFRLREDCCSDKQIAGVFFNFQFKTGSFVVNSKTAWRWIALSDHAPIILLHILSKDIERQEFRYLVLHDWMMRNPGRVARLSKQTSVTFSILDFQKVGPNGENFFQSLLIEANRVLGQPSLWRTRRSPHLPIRESDFFRHFGHLSTFETSIEVLKAAATQPSALLRMDLFEQLHSSWQQAIQSREYAPSPELRKWLNNILILPNRKERAYEIAEFKKFVNAMRCATEGKLFDFAEFTYPKLACWRVFVQLYPESMRLLEVLASRPHCWTISQRKAAAVLLSTIASTDEFPFNGRAHDALRQLASHYLSQRSNNFKEYCLTRQLYFTLAEADDGFRAAERCRDFIFLHPWEWELRLHHAYYRNTNWSMQSSLHRKVDYSKPRDVRVRPVIEFLLDRFSIAP